MGLWIFHLAMVVFTIDDLHAAVLPTREEVGRILDQLSLGRAALSLKRINPLANLAGGLIGLVVLLSALVDTVRPRSNS